MLTAIQSQGMNCCKSFLDFSARFVQFFVWNHVFIFCNLFINEVVSFEFTVFRICTFVLVYLLSIFVYQQNNASKHVHFTGK